MEQATIVPLMQADRRLVKDVEHADEAGADLGGEPDALAFSAGQRGGGAIQRQIIQADVDQKSQPFANFFQDAMGDDQFALGEFQRREKSRQPPARRDRVTSAIDCLAILTDRLSGLSRAPWQTSQGSSNVKSSSSEAPGVMA